MFPCASNQSVRACGPAEPGGLRSTAMPHRQTAWDEQRNKPTTIPHFKCVRQERGVKYRFSILMPVYNRQKYVGEAIDSVLAQTFKDYEIFAIDDGSTDLSAAVLVSYGTRIKLLQQPNQGPEVARNKAAALAQGEYLVFLDSDDFFFPFALETFDQVIQNFDSPPLVLGSVTFFHENAGKEPEIPAAHPVKAFKYQDYL